MFETGQVEMDRVYGIISVFQIVVWFVTMGGIGTTNSMLEILELTFSAKFFFCLMLNHTKQFILKGQNPLFLDIFPVALPSPFAFIPDKTCTNLGVKLHPKKAYFEEKCPF